MSKMTVFENIFLYGLGSPGTATFSSEGIEFSSGDKSKEKKKMVKKEKMLKSHFMSYGNKGQLQVVLKDGSSVELDGFKSDEWEKVKKVVESLLEVTCEKFQPACDGGHFGDVVLNDSSLQMNSAKTGKRSLELKLHNVTQCVLPGNSKDEVEIQFYDNDEETHEEDCLVQIRMRFPRADEDSEETPAEVFQKRIMERGMIRSVTGDVIAEFTEDQGTFITPRGRYAMQMYSTFLRMHGSKYDYKISYDDIGTIYLLHRPDEITSSIVISLEKPIRQGNQKYPFLVLQSNRLEHTMQINLTEEEIAEKYDGKLMPEMTMAMDSLVATIFKVLAQSKVLITRHFKSDKGHDCVKCSLKQNDGLLYPFEKSIIFIHKPTVLIKYNDIESVEYGRYKTDKHSATKNFDLKLILRPSVQAYYGDVKEFEFAGIERQEFNNLHSFLKSKKLKVEEVEVASKSLVEELGEDIPEDSDEEDDDYNSDNASESSSGDDSDDSGLVEIASSEGKSKKRKKSDSGSGKQASKKKAGKPEKKQKKDKNAPKGAQSAYILFGNDVRASIKEATPGISATDVMKEIGSKWKELSKEEKAPYEEKAVQDKSRYQEELATYNDKKAAEGSDDYDEDEDEEDSPVKKKKQKKKKDENAPKKPSSAYIFFGQSARASIKAKNPDMPPKEIMRELGVQWKAMSAEEKKPYEEMARKDKQRHEDELDVYKEQHPEAAPAAKKRKKAPKEEAAGEDDSEESAASSDSEGSDEGSLSEEED